MVVSAMLRIQLKLLLLKMHLSDAAKEAAYKIFQAIKDSNPDKAKQVDIEWQEFRTDVGFVYDELD